jgi:hypothetical protein
MNVNSHTPQTSGVIDLPQNPDSASSQSLPWVNSTGDLLHEKEMPKPQGVEDVGSTDSEDTHHHNDPENSLGLPDESPSHATETKMNGTKKEPLV